MRKEISKELFETHKNDFYSGLFANKDVLLMPNEAQRQAFISKFNIITFDAYKIALNIFKFYVGEENIDLSNREYFNYLECAIVNKEQFKNMEDIINYSFKIITRIYNKIYFKIYIMISTDTNNKINYYMSRLFDYLVYQICTFLKDINIFVSDEMLKYIDLYRKTNR